MKKFIDVSFNMHSALANPEIVIQQHKEGSGYVEFLQKKFDVTVVEHINYEGRLTQSNVQYAFFKSRNKFFHIPLKTILFIRKEAPDFAVVQGTIFPFQLIVLKMLLPRHTLLLVQHHGNLPFSGLKKVFQQIADSCTDAYLFTALGNVKIWKDKKVIKKNKPCYEVLEGSTLMKQQNKQACRAKLKIDADEIFLWVGRLNAEKDPVTVLHGFEKYVQTHPNAKLYMIYQVATLLSEVKAVIGQNNSLKNAVVLVGKVEHEELESWYSAADIYLSCSYREGSGYALIEAMACGCIPVVTDIPSFCKITGGHAFLFSPGDVAGLFNALVQSSEVSRNKLSAEIVGYFNRELSFEKIAEDIYDVCTGLISK